MKPINFPGSIIIKSNGEENCMHMYAQPLEYPVQRDHITPEGDIKTGEFKARFWRECWQPSQKDIENILAGRGVWLELHCYQLVPVSLYTVDANGNAEEPKFDDNLKPE
jgi:hypothetical protein